jgi:hypothetical protein
MRPASSIAATQRTGYTLWVRAFPSQMPTVAGDPRRTQLCSRMHAPPAVPILRGPKLCLLAQQGSATAYFLVLHHAFFARRPFEPVTILGRQYQIPGTGIISSHRTMCFWICSASSGPVPARLPRAAQVRWVHWATCKAFCLLRVVDPCSRYSLTLRTGRLAEQLLDYDSPASSLKRIASCSSI